MAEEQQKPASQSTPAPVQADSDSLDAPAETPPNTESASAAAAKNDEKPAALRFAADTPVESLKSSFNIYFVIFVFIVLVSIGIIFYTVSAARKGAKTTQTKAPSLTSQQLAELKGNTTLVGDSKTTLDVASNSVFENQVLIRQDLSVAGGLTIGKGVNLPSITVGNEGTFGSIAIGNDLNVKGNTVLQGTVTVQKNLSVSGTASFASLSVGPLTVTDLKLNGDFTITRHIITNGTSVSMTRGSAIGGNGTVSVGGTDTAGTITVNTGSAPGPGTIVTVNFGKPYDSVPRVLISPVGVSAGALDYYVNRTPTSFSVGVSTAPPAGASFAFDYFVIN